MSEITETIALLRALDPASAQALEEIARERFRQIKAENYNAEWDDANGLSQLAHAAAAYAMSACRDDAQVSPTTIWPWMGGLKPATVARDLERSGALMVAALACHLRSAIAGPDGTPLAGSGKTIPHNPAWKE